MRRIQLLLESVKGREEIYWHESPLDGCILEVRLYDGRYAGMLEMDIFEALDRLEEMKAEGWKVLSCDEDYLSDMKTFFKDDLFMLHLADEASGSGEIHGGLTLDDVRKILNLTEEKVKEVRALGIGEELYLGDLDSRSVYIVRESGRSTGQANRTGQQKDDLYPQGPAV